MLRRMLPHLALALVGLGSWMVSAAPVHAQAPSQQMQRFYYYPYQYFPHNYWPATTPRWPEAPGMPYMRPPAYQAYPPYLEPTWRYEFWQPQKYYRGSHFWLDQF